ncbi:GTPase Era [Buchnera aphidicola]|uniref:GTPase Era n=1 Tax=Buchnera aphidicola (Therioaphis trifolii) TaxID=1241884 RepID=A0A4D6YG61_9GAMM|nr:GTPase Era [Buchnera aphidicola]QCI27173.1 GTPase Era [Buchnera aphidicola (Therioaphis trifolii)]
MKKNITYCGHIGIIGRTNVGKSSILNKLINNKISITSKKSGTTINNIIGIKTIQQYQYIYIDTPGIEIKKKYFKKNILNKNNYLKLIIFVISTIKWLEPEEKILKILKKINISTILVINKIDYINNKKILLPFINKIKKKYNFIAIIPISAKTGENIDALNTIIKNNIPQSKYIYSKNEITPLSKKFLISEIIREKLIRFLNQEIPYLIKVIIESYYIDKFKICNIVASIFTKNLRQKKIIIGKNGKKIKMCHYLSKKDIEKLLNMKVKLYLKIKLFNLTQ